MCTSGMPEAPDAAELIQLGTQANQDTASYSAGLNSVDQVNPWGSSTYTMVPGVDGAPDQYTQTTSLTPQLQSIANIGTEGLGYTAEAGRQSAWDLAYGGGLQDITSPDLVTDFGSNDYSADKQAVQDALFSELGEESTKDLATLETSLKNKGISEDSDAWSRAMDDYNEGVSADRTNALLAAGTEQSRLMGLDTANKTATNDALTQQLSNTVGANAANINNTLGLTTGGAVPTPTFGTTPSTGVAGVDAAGISTDAYNASMDAWNAQQSQLGGIFGTLGSLGSSLLTLSDPKMKTDKRKIGETDDGLGIYSYRYKGSPKTEIGLMADEVEKAKPQAVQKIGGIRFVEYGEALR